MKTCAFCCVHTYGGILLFPFVRYVRTQRITAKAVYIRSCHGLDSHKAPNPASGWIGHIVAVFQIVFTCMGNYRIAEAPGFQGREPILITPHPVDGIQVFGADGSICTCRSARTSSCPEFHPAFSPPWHARGHRDASPEDISLSDGHSVVKVHP